jgi:hypothetical protein
MALFSAVTFWWLAFWRRACQCLRCAPLDRHGSLFAACSFWNGSFFASCSFWNWSLFAALLLLEEVILCGKLLHFVGRGLSVHKELVIVLQGPTIEMGHSSQRSQGHLCSASTNDLAESG